MPFYKQFDLFDPKDGAVPSHPFSLLPNIVRRARSILHERNRDEILIAAELVDSMIQNYFDQEKDLFIEDQLQTNGWVCKYLDQDARNAVGLRDLVTRGLPDAADSSEYFDFPASDRTTEVEALKDCIDNHRTEYEGFSNAKQQEYFAVLALWLIGDCLHWLQSGKQPTGAIADPIFNLSIAGQHALLAMDAVCYAEHLSAVTTHFENISHGGPEFYRHQQRVAEMVVTKAAELRSETSRQGAAKRHEENTAMREEAIRYYEEHEATFKSAEAAANVIAGTIVPVAHRTVADWIRAHRRLRPAGRP